VIVRAAKINKIAEIDPKWSVRQFKGKMNKEPEVDFEQVKGTWAYELRQHFDAFSNACWKGFNSACEAMKDEPMDKYKWRGYVLWDMQKKHREEVKSSLDGLKNIL